MKIPTQLKITDFSLGPEIGKGAYAAVFSSTEKTTNLKYAIKIYDKLNNFNLQKKYSIKNEITILKKLEHKNIVKLRDAIETPNEVRYN